MALQQVMCEQCGCAVGIDPTSEAKDDLLVRKYSKTATYQRSIYCDVCGQVLYREVHVGEFEDAEHTKKVYRPVNDPEVVIDTDALGRPKISRRKPALP
jgi:hypothetical protein